MTVAARDLVGLRASAERVVVADSPAHAAALDAVTPIQTTACTWPGSRAHWRQANWSALRGCPHPVSVVACKSAASRKRAEAIAAHLHSMELDVHVCLPTGSDGTGPADWTQELGGGDKMLAYVGGLRRPYEPPQAEEAPVWTPPDASTEWALRNEWYEVLGHEGGHVTLRWGGELQTVLQERLHSPSKLRSLAPMSYWHQHTGQERMTRDVADSIGWVIQQGVREHGPLAAYDMDGDLVGIPGDRVLRLSTGEIRGRQRLDRIMRSLAVEPAEGEPSLWLDTIGGMLEHHGQAEAIIDYLRRWMGVSLTTDCSDESILMLHGQPGSGKSAIMDTWCQIAGSYCETLPGSYLVGSGVATVRHLVARLRLARVIRVGELPESGRWSTSEDVNALASGEAIVADRKHRDAIEFRSVGHFFLSANKVPRAHPSSGIYRRLRILQLRPVAEPNPHLKRSLRAKDSMGKILSWALSGLRDGGLGGIGNTRSVPQALRSPVDSLRESEDVIASWMSDRCESDPNAITPVGELFESFEDWRRETKQADAEAFTISKFSRQLTQIGQYPVYLMPGTRVRCRIGLRLA